MRRVFYYALGGGLGHVTRSLAAIHTLPITGPVRLAISSQLASEIETPGNVELITPPAGLDPFDRASVADWIAAASSEFEPDEWFVDCFPAGVLGELRIESKVTKTLITRRVEWSAYLRRAPDIASWPRFFRSYASEPLGVRQTRDLETIGPSPDPLVLRDCCGPNAQRKIDLLVRNLGPHSRTHTRLVVHSGRTAETEEILARAQADSGHGEPILLVTPEASCPRPLASNVTLHAVFPVWPLFAYVARIYTAAGANSMRQLAILQDRHSAVPLDRPLDDQARRLRRRDNAVGCKFTKRSEIRTGKRLNPTGSTQ